MRLDDWIIRLHRLDRLDYKVGQAEVEQLDYKVGQLDYKVGPVGQ